MDIMGFAVTRTPVSVSASTPSVGLWIVTGLYLDLFDKPAMPIFQLVHSHLPRISILTIRRQENGQFPVDDFISSLSALDSLQVVSLVHELDLGENSCEQMQRYRELGSGETKAAMIQYASQLACGIPSIEAFFIRKELRSAHFSYTHFEGWISAQELYGSGTRNANEELLFVPEPLYERVVERSRTPCATLYM
ncbi:hypothetical protein BT96DRAFT_1018346 [Gymnopus androsaceus JB14]|uniref:Uncharacterized protein n=1 Tax=Gymnopus androsaceus JB14 TaxID=1447944 RepID=A0A6A4HSP8_9AGAR|nr:hypothetical protein BT96DRAFT_1018346 [Gymnopus androsaceus JB14]